MKNTIFPIGQKIRAVYIRNKDYTLVGTVEKVIKPKTPLTDDELWKYGKLKPKDRNYQSVQGRNCSKVRLVLSLSEREHDYAIVPINSITWQFLDM